MRRRAWSGAVAGVLACAVSAAGQAPPRPIPPAPAASISPPRATDGPREGDVLTFRTAGQPDRQLKVLRLSGYADGESLVDLQDLSTGARYTVPGRVLTAMARSAHHTTSPAPPPAAAPPQARVPGPSPAPAPQPAGYSPTQWGQHAKPTVDANGWPVSGAAAADAAFPTDLRTPAPSPGSYTPFARPQPVLQPAPVPAADAVAFRGVAPARPRQAPPATDSPPPPPPVVVESVFTQPAAEHPAPPVVAVEYRQPAEDRPMPRVEVERSAPPPPVTSEPAAPPAPPAPAPVAPPAPVIEPPPAAPVRPLGLVTAVEPVPMHLVRYEAYVPTGDPMSDEIGPYLRDLFGALRPSVRLRAATGLAEGRYGSRPGVKYQLAKAAASDPDVTVRAHCVRLLSRLGYCESEYLDDLAAWADTGPAVVKSAAREALAKLAPR